MYPSTAMLSRFFLCVQLLVAFSFISVNGYRNSNRFTNFARNSMHASSNIYLNELYEEMEKHPEYVYKFDFPGDDDILKFLKYIYEHLCDGYDGISGLISYGALPHSVEPKIYAINRIHCELPDKLVSKEHERALELFQGPVSSIHVIESETEYLENLKAYGDKNCADAPSIYLAIYVSPKASRSKGSEFYLTVPECDLFG